MSELKFIVENTIEKVRLICELPDGRKLTVFDINNEAFINHDDITLFKINSASRADAFIGIHVMVNQGD